MATRNTKQKIILASIQLFNEAGIANVRLQQIADASGISVGNLAYHYRNKEAIIIAALDYIYENTKEVFVELKANPSFDDFDSKLSAYFQTITEFSFFWKDLEELRRSFSEEVDIHVKRINICIKSIQLFFRYNQSIGLLKAETVTNQYRHLAKVVWMLIAFWVQQRMFIDREVYDLTAFKSMIWNTILPFLTEEGMLAYKDLEA